MFFESINYLAALDPALTGKAGAVLLVIGLVFVVILTIAWNKLKVEKDPIVEAVENVLPGANCGGCGLAGCGAYAEEIVKDHSLLGKCGPGGDSLVHEIAAILGIEAESQAPIRAVVHCNAHRKDQIERVDYNGPATCFEAQMIPGPIGCPYGCIGYGDCAKACDFGALSVVEGLAVVDYEKCVGCGACIDACPRGIIQLVPMAQDPLLVVACSTLDRVKDVKEYCQVGCVACTLCAKNAPDTFTMKNNLPVIDYETYGEDPGRDTAVEKCPRNMLVYVGKNAAQGNVVISAAETTAG